MLELKNSIKLKKIVNGKETYIPLIDQDSAETVLTVLEQCFVDYDFELGTHDLNGLIIAFVKMTLESGVNEIEAIRNVLIAIGHLGGLASKDALLDIYVSGPIQGVFGFTANGPKPDMHRLLDQFLNCVGKRLGLDKVEIKQLFSYAEPSFVKMSLYASANIEQDIKELLAKKLQVIPNENETFPEARDFYFRYLNSLFNNLLPERPKRLGSNDHFATMKQMQIDLALIRLRFKLEYARCAENYEQFILNVEFAMDEIMVILGLLNKYSESEIYAILNKRIQQLMDTKPANVAIHGSGIHAVTSIVIGAKEFFNRSKFSNSNITIATTENIFYEITSNLSTLKLSCNVAQNIDNTSNTIAQVLILSFNDNVIPGETGAGHGSTDVIEIIKRQVILRKHNHAADKLIVILDSTMSNLEDPEFQLLLCIFAEEIKIGKLAVFIAHSLNKFYSLGLDRSAAGISAGFYNPTNFFNDQIPNFATNRLVGYRSGDVTSQNITHNFLHAFKYPSEYHERMRSAARYLHDKLNIADLYDVTKPMNIDPYKTVDIYQIPWCFFVFRMDGLIKLFPSKELYITQQISHLIAALNIPYRDGYGFSETTYTLVGVRGRNAAIRISIGPDASLNKFKLITEYIREINSAFSKTIIYRGMANKNLGHISNTETMHLCVEAIMRTINEKFRAGTRPAPTKTRSFAV